MADTRDNRRERAQARPGGKGTGKVTAGHDRSQRRGMRGGRAATSNQKSAAKGQKPAVQEEKAAVAEPEPSIVAPAAEGAALSAVEGVGSTRVRDRRRLSEKMGKSTRMRLWLQSSALDFLLVLVVSVALVYTVSYGFYSAEAYRGNVLLLAGLCLPLLLVLFAGSWSKRAVLFSALGALALSCVYIGAATALSPDPALFAEGGVNDAAGNYTIFAIVLCVTTILTYLLSRRTAILSLLAGRRTAIGALTGCPRRSGGRTVAGTADNLPDGRLLRSFRLRGLVFFGREHRLDGCFLDGSRLLLRFLLRLFLGGFRRGFRFFFGSRLFLGGLLLRRRLFFLFLLHGRFHHLLLVIVQHGKGLGMRGLRLQLLLLLFAHGFLVLLPVEFHIHPTQRVKQGIRVLTDSRCPLQNTGSFFYQTLGGIFQVHLCHSTFVPPCHIGNNNLTSRISQTHSLLTTNN